MQHVSFTTGAEGGRAIDLLAGLVDACRDAEKGYRDSAADARDPTYRALFTHYSQQRAQFASALEDILTRYGASAAPNSRRMVGALRRGWLDLKSVLEGSSDHALLTACERGDDAAERDYATALAAGLPYDVELIVKAQYEALQQAHAEVRRLRDLPR